MKRFLKILGVFVLLTSLVYAQAIETEQYKIDGTSRVEVSVDGNAKAEETLKATPTIYLALKQLFPTTYMLKREFENKRTNVEYVNMKIDWDDSNNQIKATYSMLGAAVNKGDKWEIQVTDKKTDTSLSTITGNALVLTMIQPLLGGQGRMVETITVILPQDSKNIKFQDGIITYERPAWAGGDNTMYLFLIIVSIAALVFVNFGKVQIAQSAVEQPKPVKKKRKQ
jgi:hypothetical protein